MEINQFIENKKMYYILPSWFADLHLHYTKLKVLIFQYDTRNIRFVEIELRIYERKQKKEFNIYSCNSVREQCMKIQTSCI